MMSRVGRLESNRADALTRTRTFPSIHCSRTCSPNHGLGRKPGKAEAADGSTPCLADNNVVLSAPPANAIPSSLGSAIIRRLLTDCDSKRQKFVAEVGRLPPCSPDGTLASSATKIEGRRAFRNERAGIGSLGTGERSPGAPPSRTSLQLRPGFGS